jgi:hypothetical protein
MPPDEEVRAEALRLVRYNRGRSRYRTPSGFYPSNFAEPSELHRYAAAKGLISPQDAAVLGLDSLGRDLPPVAVEAAQPAPAWPRGPERPEPRHSFAVAAGVVSIGDDREPELPRPEPPALRPKPDPESEAVQPSTPPHWAGLSPSRRAAFAAFGLSPWTTGGRL